MLPYIGITLAFFIVPLFLVAVYPVVRWSERAHWHKGEAILALSPYVVWAGLIFSEAEADKSLSNLGAEPVVLALLVGALVCVRIWLAKPLGPTRAATYCGLLAATLGWLVWWPMPGLTE
jgi:hypothetical protein